jgi:hypothetical protein
MINEKEPKFYEDWLNKTKEPTQDEVEDYLAEVSSILIGLEKGLKILEGMGRKPDAKVVENQKRFNEIKRKLLALVK